MKRRLLLGGTAVAVALALLAVGTLLGPRWTSQAAGQEGEADVPRVELLMQDIHFLELLRNLGLTAAQRLQAAQAIEAFHQKRKAIETMGETDELLQALAALRDVLLQGKTPTNEMREAVEMARPPDDGSADRAFHEARLQVVEQLVGVLTDEQKAQLQMMPLVELANHIIGMSLEAREMGDEEFNDWRNSVAAEFRERFGVEAGEEADAAREVILDLTGRLRAMTPDQIMAEREKLVPQAVTALRDVLPQNPEAAWDRLADQLWEWVVNPRAGVVLRESAKAMGAE